MQTPFFCFFVIHMVLEHNELQTDYVFDHLQSTGGEGGGGCERVRVVRM